MDRFTFKKFLNEGKTQVLNQALSATANGALKDIKTKIYRAQDIISNELGIKLDKVGGKARAYKEFLRGPLGLDRESVENNVKKIFDKILKSDYQLVSFGDFDKKLDGGSGTYNSLECNIRDKKSKETFTLVATTNQRENIALKNKDLVPNKLGVIGGKDYTASSLVSTIESKLKDTSLSDNIKSVIIELLDDLLSGRSTLSGVFSGTKDFAKAINNIVENDGSTGEIISTLTKNTQQAISNISSNDLHSILKDLGEILQPLMIAQNFKGIKIGYPSESNAKLVDFHILNKGIKYDISAKAGSGGVPSGVTYFDIVSEINKANPSFFTKEEKDFISKIGESFNQSVTGQQIQLVNTLLVQDVKYSTKEARDCYNKIGIDSWVSLVDAVSKADAYFKKNSKVSKKDFFTKLYTGVGYDLKKLKDFPVDTIDRKWDDLEVKTKYGILIYPAWSRVVQILNDNYADILTSVLQKVSMIYQGHLYYNSGKLSLIIKAGAKSKYGFKTGGISTKNITGAKLGIKIK